MHTCTRWLIGAVPFVRVQVAKLKRMRQNIEQLDIMNRQLALLRSFQVWMWFHASPLIASSVLGCMHTLTNPPAARQEYDEDGRGELDAHEVRAAVRDSTEQVRPQPCCGLRATVDREGSTDTLRACACSVGVTLSQVLSQLSSEAIAFDGLTPSFPQPPHRSSRWRRRGRSSRPSTLMTTAPFQSRQGPICRAQRICSPRACDVAPLRSF